MKYLLLACALVLTLTGCYNVSSEDAELRTVPITNNQLLLPGSARQAIPSGSIFGVLPGFQARNTPSGSNVVSSTVRSIPGKPAPGVCSWRREEPARSTSRLAWWSTGPDLDRFHPARTG